MWRKGDIYPQDVENLVENVDNCGKIRRIPLCDVDRQNGILLSLKKNEKWGPFSTDGTW